MPGLNVFHGVATSSAPQGLGGSARVETSALSSGGSETNFFLWVGVLGIVVPILLIGGLQIGGFAFVFRR